jgi:hypothetical protein
VRGAEQNAARAGGMWSLVMEMDIEADKRHFLLHCIQGGGGDLPPMNWSGL